MRKLAHFFLELCLFPYYVHFANHGKSLPKTSHRYYFAIIILSLGLNVPIQAQTLSPAEIQRTIDSLKSRNDDTLRWAMDRISKNNLTGAIGTIEQEFWKKEVAYQLNFLELLARLHAPSTSSFGYVLIDSAGHEKLWGLDSSFVRLKVTNILYSIGDYSTTKYLFACYEKDKQNLSVTLHLRDVIQHDPIFADSAKNVLKNTIHSSPSPFQREIALLQIPRFDSAWTTLFIECVVKDDYLEIRNELLDRLAEFPNRNFDTVFIDRMQHDPSPSIRSTAAGSLLNNNGTLTNFHTVVNQYRLEKDTIAKDGYEFYIDQFTPPKPDSTSTASVKIDSLVSFNHQCANYGWIGDSTYIVELDSILDLARNAFSTGGSIRAIHQIKIFQRRLREDFEDSLDHDNKWIKGAAAIYLLKYSYFIPGALPSSPPIYQLKIKSIGSGTVNKMPDQTYYDSASVVTITAIAATGYTFTNWSGDATGTTNPLTVTMNANKTVTATFRKR